MNKTAEEIGRDFVEALEEVGYRINPYIETLNEWNDYMKSRKGLAMLIATYPPDISVECAVGASWLNWFDQY